MSTRKRRADGGVAYLDVEGTLRERTVNALRDRTLRGNLDTAATSWGEGRDAMREDHGLDEMRERAREIRRSNIRNLPALLTGMQAKVREAGGTVVRAADGAEACRYITGLAQARGVKVVAKSKSMATE